MAKKDEKKNGVSIKKVEKPLIKLNSLFNDIIDNISYNTSKSDNRREKELKKLSDEIDDIVFQEIKSLTTFTGDDISTFLVKLFNDYDNQQQTAVKGIEDIFASETNGIFQFFQERYKNLNLLYDDLNMICSQLYELQEAIAATRDAIVTSDDLSQTVSRTLKFKNSNEKEKAHIALIENMEKKFKILSKIKNHIVPKTLQYGVYYAYTIPYSELFNKYYQNKVKDKKRGIALESTVDDEFVKDFKKDANMNSFSGDIKKSFKEYLEGYEVYNDEPGIPIVEGVEMSTLTSMITDEKFRKRVDEEFKKAGNKKKASVYSDGTVSMDEKVDFSNIKDCYVKLIDPRKIIPVKILDQTIGYYYIHEIQMETTKSPFTTTIKMSPANNNIREVENVFLSKITDKIVKAFDKKFLEENAKFKELILNALTYNDLYKKQLKFQFIPIDYITEFKVNEDEEGNGTSTLLPSLFYAKLYLALLIFKMISIISSSNDTKVYYVKQSGIDANVVNKIQDVARSIKEKQVNFMDLLNYNSMISKIGQGKSIFMPIGRSGERGIDFDVIAGQDIQLNSELMDMLRTGYINATGVPSVLMNYINEADYAKTLVMANAKFVGRVVNQQLDFNDAITDLYKKLIKYSTDIPSDLVNEFEFILAAPKSLNNMNMADLINNSEQTLTFMIKAYTGENADQTDNLNRLKDILYRRFAKELLPMMPWATADKIFEEAQVELQQQALKAKDESEKGNETE